MRASVLLTLLLLPFAAEAVEITPFEEANISESEFAQYHAIVSRELASTHRAYTEHFLEVYSDESTRASIAFTLPGHPAHPAWVTRHVLMDEDSISMNVVGYYAGDKGEFEKLFNQYRAMAEETTRQFSQ